MDEKAAAVPMTIDEALITNSGMDENPYKAPHAAGNGRVFWPWLTSLLWIACELSLAGVGTAFLWVGHWQTWMSVLLVAAVVVLFATFHPDVREERRYEIELARRDPVTDEELVSRYFTTGHVTPEVPVFVRRMFAKHMFYPAEKMLPDDDLNFFWNDVDGIYLIQELEGKFAISISDADAEQTQCTIRSVSAMVDRLRTQTMAS